MSTTTRAHTTIEKSLAIDDFLPDWAEQFHRAKRVEGLSSHSLAFYRQQLAHFLRYSDAQVITRLSEITPGIVRAYLLWLEETGHNPGGVHAAYRTLRAFLRWYESEAEPPAWKNPLLKVKPPKVGIEPLEPVTLDTVSALAAACAGPGLLDLRDKAILLCLLDTGARAAEFCALDLADVDQVTGEALIRQGKGKKPRTVFIGKTARKALRAYLRARRDDCAALFASDTSAHLTVSGLRAIVSRRAALAGVDAPGLHDFRRAFAVNMLRAGVDLESIRRLMGHSDFQVLRRYLALDTGDLQKAHEAGSPVEQLGKHKKGGKR